MLIQANKMDTPQSNYVIYQNPMVIEQNFGEIVNDFTSPIIPHVQPLQSLGYGAVFTSIFRLDNQQRIDKTHWICDYSDDIFQTLRETELSRRLICYRSHQVFQRPDLLKLLKTATEKHKLCRTTLHLVPALQICNNPLNFFVSKTLFYIFSNTISNQAVYFLDCFMDNYTIRADKLNLSALTCLIIAAKIEESDVNIPKFSDLNKMFNDCYTLNEFKTVECKVLGTFNFDLIRPTAATFAEYFASSIVTLQDYHIFVNHWNNEIILNNYHQQQQDLQTRINYSNEVIINSPCMVIGAPCPYTSYENMLITLSKTFFDLIDTSLSYLKFANARPSLIASACIAVVRQMHGIFPIWSPYLIKVTHCTVDMISPFVEAILAIYRMQYNNEQLQSLQTTPNTPLSTTNYTTILCDSPDSGVVSGNDTKSTISDTDNEDNFVASLDASNICNISADSEDDAYDCLEYPIQAKRRRLF